MSGAWIDRSYNAADLTGEMVWIEEGSVNVTTAQIASGVRIGIDYAEEYAAQPWRFWLRDNPYVSKRLKSRDEG